MSETDRSVRVDIVQPGEETKTIEHSCDKDLGSVITALHSVRDELSSHVKKLPGGPIEETQNDHGDDEDTSKSVAKKRKQSKPSKIQRRKE